MTWMYVLGMMACCQYISLVGHFWGWHSLRLHQKWNIRTAILTLILHDGNYLGKVGKAVSWCLKCSKCTSSTQQWSTAILHWRSVQHNQTSTKLNGNLYWSQLDQTRTIQPKRQEGGNNSGPNKEPPWVAHWPAGSFVLVSWVGRSILLCPSDLNRRWFRD